ncbi:hypothetical protein [Rickettsia felis]|uniref:hypothetical protein n=1 Tax=Rickettsia felis TaxID=42862 RepID=UPI001F3D7149|nr:hypothetical protein [Rickettsia felis]
MRVDILRGPLIVIARSEATWQSRKRLKKFCKSEFFTGLLRQLLRNFPRNDGKPVHAVSNARLS